MFKFKTKRKNKKRRFLRGGITLIVPYSKSECKERLSKVARRPYSSIRFEPQPTGQLAFYITEEWAWAKGELTAEDAHSTRVRFHSRLGSGALLAFAGLALFMLVVIDQAIKEEGRTSATSLLIFVSFVLFTLPVFWIWLHSHKQKTSLRDAVLKVLDAPPDTTYRRTVHLYLIGNNFLYTSFVWSWLILLFDYVGCNVYAATGATLLVGLGLAVYLHVLRYVGEYVIYR